MKIRVPATCLFATILVATLSGCLMRQTVTENGEVISSDYVVKRPIKDVIENSESSD